MVSFAVCSGRRMFSEAMTVWQGTESNMILESNMIESNMIYDIESNMIESNMIESNMI